MAYISVRVLQPHISSGVNKYLAWLSETQECSRKYITNEKARYLGKKADVIYLLELRFQKEFSVGAMLKAKSLVIFCDTRIFIPISIGLAHMGGYGGDHPE